MELSGISNNEEIKVVPAGYDNAQMSQEDFLKVLLANIEWQDPLEAQDISEFIDNAVKLREMELMNSFENSVSTMTASLSSYSLFMASSLIGKKIKYAGNQTYIEGGKGEITFALSQPASQVKVVITDSYGNIVEEKLFTNLEPGSYPIEIDNPNLPDGYYSVNITAVGYDGEPLEPTVYSLAYVEEVRRDDDGKIYLYTAAGEVAIEDVISIGG
jgi:flagellar basal-body rod modification protein FlgD